MNCVICKGSCDRKACTWRGDSLEDALGEKKPKKTTGDRAWHAFLTLTSWFWSGMSKP